MPTADNDVKTAVIQRFREIASRCQAINAAMQQHHEALSKLQQELNAFAPMANDCYAAARLFNFDLIAEATALSHQEHPTETITEASLPVLTTNGKTIREIVLEELKKAHPQSLKASEIRARIEGARGEKIHDKTVGMTLYRLSQDSAVRREGKANWFFVPSKADAKNPGGDTPGPINNVFE